jgi:hypothetical protein
MSQIIKKVILHQKDSNNNDIIMRPQSETSQIVDFDLAVNNLIDAKISTLPVADENEYPLADNIDY